MITNKNNAGFTLIELLVAMAIMGIVSTGAAVGINMKNNRNVKAVAEKIDSHMDSIRMHNMTKTTTKDIVISVNNDGEYFMKVGDSDEEKIASGGIKISYITDAGKILINSPSNSFLISFNRDGTFNCRNSSSSDKIDVKGLYVTNGGKKYTLTMVSKTGKHYLE